MSGGALRCPPPRRRPATDDRAGARPQGPLHRSRRGAAVRDDRAPRGHRRPRPPTAGDLRATDRAVRAARLRGFRHLRAREGRQRPLPAQRALRRPRQRGAVPPLHGRPRRARPRAGGIPQGRARYRPHHGPVRAASVRRRAHRHDVGDQAAVRSGRDPQPRRRAVRRPGLVPPGSQACAHGGAGGGPLRGVRLLRADVPEQGHHTHATAAHRPPPGHGLGRGAGRYGAAARPPRRL